MATALDKIKSLQDQIAKEVEAVKTELAKQLAKACETLKTVRELQKPGASDVLLEPQYEEYMSELGICATLAPTTIRTGGKRVNQEDLTNAILTALKDGPKTHPEIKAALKPLYAAVGKEPGTQFIKLDSMAKQKKLVKTGSGKASKYALK